MPTIQEWTEYEHITGLFLFCVGFFFFVGFLLFWDTMSLLCLPNHVKDKLVKANLIIAKGLNDVPLSKKTAEPVTKKVIEVYNDANPVIKCDYKPLADLIKPVYYTLIQQPDSPYIESPGKPPNTSC